MLYRTREQLQAVVRQIQLTRNGRGGSDLEDRLENLENAAILQARAPSTVPHQSVNIIKNGDVSHSVRTYHLDPPPLDDSMNMEAAFWFSHAAVAINQALSIVDGRTNLANDTLKTTGHSTYTATRCRWDRVIGAAELCGGATVETVIDQPIFRAGFTAHLVIGRIALSNRNIAVPDEARLFAGLWAKQAGTWNWITAASALALAATPSNPGTKEYRYRLHVRTDRGFEFLSNEVVVPNAPNVLGGNNFVQLNWATLPNAGIFSYDLYRYDPVAAQYVELRTPGSASNYQDNGSIKRIVSGYPTGDFDRAIAYEATPTGELARLPRNGVSVWRTLSFALNLPSGFNLATLESQIFVRFGITGLVNNKFDLRVDDAIVTSGVGLLESAEGLFSASHDGLNYKLYHPTDASIFQTGTIEFEDATHVMLSPAPTFSASGAKLIIRGGGPAHGLLADLFHLSTSAGAVYAPHPEDFSSARRQFPASLPNGSTQGGTGTPGGGDGEGGGVIHCVWEEETAYRWIGEKIKPTRFGDLKLLDSVYYGAFDQTQIIDIKPGFDDIYTLETENGIIERCTKTEVIIRSPLDERGAQLQTLKPGDEVLTIQNGLPEVSRIARIFLFKRNQKVITLSLSARPLFLAGHAAPQALHKRVWKWLKEKLLRRAEPEISGVVNHNRKPEREIPF